MVSKSITIKNRKKGEKIILTKGGEKNEVEIYKKNSQWKKVQGEGT